MTDSTPRQQFLAISDDVQQIMERNTAIYQENPAYWYYLTAIGSTMLRDLGHNPNSVKRWIELNADRLAEHHASVGITDVANHNRRAGKARQLQSTLLAMAALLPVKQRAAATRQWIDEITARQQQQPTQH